MEKKRRRRQYFRERQRFHRLKERSKHVLMEEKIRELENILHEVKNGARRPLPVPASRRGLLLPWEDVVDAMKESCEESQERQYNLRRELSASTALLRDMQQFVHDMVRPSSWRQTTLFMDPSSRRMGKTWIAQHMYFNAQRVFESYALPPPGSDDLLQDCNLVFDDDDAGYHLIQRSHIIFDGPMDALVTLNRQAACWFLLLGASAPQDEPTAKEVEPPTRLHQTITDQGECLNIVVGEFRTPDRCVNVIQQIQDDQGWAHAHRQRNRSTWVEMLQVSATQTKVRVLSLISQSRTADGRLVPLDEEARVFGLATPETQDQFRRQFLERLTNRRSPALSQTNEMLARWAERSMIGG
ncbi:Aste57867_1163 [Aphanomyces stellatus]|uniref:Aste57867_1163 protein n=1 Tax=Aphanomyces stellatus TaxID=120398 RepID=A0A485K771_9STRA|nr:hypothetical protein As57867_001162 [Aphanomyces stellatus]VFT78383.1 Aste57867_1163 [Aphanomyces stellatus]